MMMRGARRHARELTAAEWLPAPFHCIRMHVFARLVSSFGRFPLQKRQIQVWNLTAAGPAASGS
jgi:hypothetical protein